MRGKTKRTAGIAAHTSPSPDISVRFGRFWRTRLAGMLMAAALLCDLAAAQQMVPPVPDLSEAALPVRAAIEEARHELLVLVRTSNDRAALNQAWLSLGDTLFVHEFNVEARTAYEAAAALDTGDARTAHRLGLLAMNDGRLDDAIEAFGRVLATGDGRLRTAALVHRGRARLEESDWAAAETDFVTALEADGSAAAALAGRGQAALGAGRPEEAARYLEQALDIDPTAARLYQPLGLAYRELGDRELARSTLARVGEGEPLVQDPVLSAIRLESRSPQFWLQAGLARADRGQLVEAAELIGRAVALAPEDLSLLANYGRVLAGLGEFTLAREAMERVVAGRDATSDDWLYLGRIRQGLGQLDAAVTAYEEALRLDPAATLPREALARLALHEGRNDDAAERFGRLAADAGSARARARFGYWEAVALLADERCGPSATLIRQAMAAESPVAPELLQLAARVRATCDDTLGNSLAETVRWAELAYREQPGLMSAETLAMSYAAAGRWEDAADLQAQAIFEAAKTGELGSRPALQGNMQRYSNEQTAERPFAKEDPIFRLD